MSRQKRQDGMTKMKYLVDLYRRQDSFKSWCSKLLLVHNNNVELFTTLPKLKYVLIKVSHKCSMIRYRAPKYLKHKLEC